MKNLNSKPVQNYQKLLRIFPAILPIPVTSVFALITGIDAIAILGVITGCLLAHLILKRQNKTWSDVGLKRKINWTTTIVISFIAAVCLLLITSIAGSAVNYLTGATPDISKFDVLRGNVGVLVTGLIIVWTTAAFGEELIFRGFILNELKELVGSWKSFEKSAWLFALLISSILFGLAHAYQGFAGIILTAIAGLGFGIVYLLRKRNLWTSVLTHGFYDTIAFILVFASYDKLIVSTEILGNAGQII